MDRYETDQKPIRYNWNIVLVTTEQMLLSESLIKRQKQRRKQPTFDYNTAYTANILLS